MSYKPFKLGPIVIKIGSIPVSFSFQTFIHPNLDGLVSFQDDTVPILIPLERVSLEVPAVFGPNIKGFAMSITIQSN